MKSRKYVTHAKKKFYLDENENNENENDENENDENEND